LIMTRLKIATLALGLLPLGAAAAETAKPVENAPKK